MTTPRRITVLLVLTALLTAAAYSAGWAWRAASEQAGAQSAAGQDPAAATADPSPTSTPDPEPSPTEKAKPDRPKSEPPEPEPTLEPGPRLLGPDDQSPEVRELQARLRQIDWFDADVTGFYGPVTTEAVRGFQAKREIPVTGYVDQRTLDRLHAMTTEPTRAELTNEPPPSAGNTPGALDPRCTTGRVLCIDKSTNTLRWVVDGAVLKTMDARFGRESMPTREGRFSVNYKSRDHVSSIYETSMPFAMFFSGGQAVHYSPDFAAVGYNDASHGCVNIRDYDGIAWLFDQVNVGDSVIVYWS